MATLIGVVSKVIGEVFAVASDGSRRQLAEGDRLFAGEQLETGATGAVAVALANGGELTLGRESSLTLDGSMLAQGTSGTTPPDGTETVNPEGTTAAAPTDQQLTDVEKLQAAIEAGQDPTQEGEATAAGPGAGGAGGPGGAGGGRSFVLLTEVGGSVDPTIGFPTEGLVRGPEFPDPEPLNRDVIDGEPSTGTTAIALDEDGDLPGSIEGSQYGDDQPNVPASVSGTLGYSFGPDGFGSFSWNAVDLSGLSSHGEPLIAVVSADGLTLTAYRGSTEGPVVFTATTTDPATGAYTFTLQLPLDHPVAGAEDNLDLNLGYTITDGNGTTAGGNLAVSVNDDSPELVRFEGEGEGQGEVFFPQLSFTVHEDALTQAPRGGEEGPSTFALPSLPLNAPYEGNNEDSDPQGADNDPSQTVHAGIEAGPGSLTSLVNFGADGIGAFSLVDSETANSLMAPQNLTSGGVALSYSVTVSGDITTLTASVPGYTVFTLQVGADGSFSFTLQGPLDHPQADGNDGETLGDGEVLGIDFTRLLTATDYDGDPVQGFGQANGLFTINVEDDVPTAGDAKAAVTLDDEGLSGGINGDPANGDVPGAAITTSGNLDYSAGADGLKSVSLSGPSTLGSEEVSSTWDASTNTLTISSARGALVTVELTNLATGAYTVTLLQPLMHGDTTTEDNITLNVGFTVTDGDSDQASGNLSVVINDDSPTIQTADLGGSSFVTFQGTNAGYSNSYGYYVKDADGNPVDGKIIWANVHNQSVGDTADISGLDPSHTGFFIIPNGATNNAGLSNGAEVTFSLVGGQWVASVGGTALVGSDGANVLFSDASLNPSGSHLQDTGTPGNQNWEDLTTTSDFDYNDVATNVTWGSTVQLQVDETNLDVNASANFSGAFNVQPGADGLQSLTYELTVSDPNSGLVDTATGQDVVLSLTSGGVIEGRTDGTGELVFTLTVGADGTVTLDQIRAVVHGNTSNPDDVDFLGTGHINLVATVTDGDGDTATGTLDLGSVISFRDDGPSIVPGSIEGIALVVDETVLGTDATADFSGAFTSSFGNDGAGTITYNLNVSAAGADSGLVDVASGDAVLLYKEGSDIVGRVGGPAGAISFTVTVDAATGVVTLDQRLALEHTPDTGPDQLNDTLAANLVQLSATITDKDGDSSTATLAIGGTLSFHDDAPVINPGEGQLPTLQVDETVLGTDATADFSGAFTSSFGEDGAGNITYSLNVSAAGADSGLVDTASGDAILVYKEGNDIVGRVGGPAGAISFTVSVDAATGVVTLDQQLAIEHSPDSGPNQPSDTLATDLIQLSGTIVDRDGDTSTATLNIGGQLSFLDDAPSISVGEGKLASLVVDESDFGSDAQVNFSTAFSHDFGADGAGSITYSLTSAADGTASGLVDTASGNAVLLYKEGDAIVGRVGGPAGAISFKLTVDSASGQVTLDQQLAVVHSPDTGPDQATGLASGLIQVTATITDKDGDSSNANLDLGNAISFHDDAPTVGQTVATTVLDDEGLPGGINGSPAVGDTPGAATSTSGTLVFNAGADGLQSIALSGPTTLGSEPVTSVWNASTNTLTISSSRGDLVTVTLTPATGAYTVNLLQPLMHPISGTEDDIALNLGVTVTDKDGDSATGSLTVTVDDDVPTIQAADLGGSSFVTFEGSSAGYNNTYGYYTKDADGNPVDGKIIWANVHSQTAGNTADISGLDPSTTGFFIIPNGASNNAGLTNGATVTFSLVSGQWVASVGGTALVGSAGANVLFTDAALNPGGSHLQDNGTPGNQNWEDLTLGSDYDYNDVATNVTWGSTLQLQVDESNFAYNATANFSGVFNVQPGADGLASQTYSLGVSNANSGLVDTATGENIVLSVTPAGVIEGRTSGSNDLVFTLTVSSTGTVTLDQLRAIVHGDSSNPDDATFLGAGHITLGSTVVDGDGDSATATVDLGQVVSFRDDGPTVSANDLVRLDDDALPNGIPGGVGDDDPNSANASGTLAHNYGADGAGSIQWLTTGAPAGFTYETSGTTLVVKQGTTTVLTVSLDSSTGAYSVQQQAPIDHALAQNENNQAFTFNYQVTDKDGDKANGTLQLNVDDDTPQARNDVATVQVSQAQSFNTVFVLDFSGSINGSELNTMLVAVKAAAQALFTGTTGDVHAQIVVFSSSAISYPTFDNYADFAAKIDALNPAAGGTRPLNDNTDFTDALHKVVTDFTPISGASNQVFFISDGNPNENTGTGSNVLTAAGATEWQNFVNNNHINVTSIGVGDGISTGPLQQVDVDGSGTPIQVGGFDALITTLVNQVTNSFVSGNVLLGSNGVVGGGDDDGWGADGPGHIQSIQINGTTYSWGGSGNITTSAGATITGSQLTNVTTAEGGKLSFNFSNGAWTYTAPTAGGDHVETFQYSIVDHDGDPSSATLTVYVQDTSPVVAQVEEDELVPGGITDGDVFTTVATGSLVDLGAPGSTPQFSLSSTTSGLASATSHGVALVYSVSGNTLTATAGAGGPQVFTLQVNANGDYTFTLKGPLDHPLANGNDGELLTLDFASILQATDGVNPIPLTGGFLVNIEDDVPVVLANPQFAGALQVDESFLATDVTVNFAGAFTGSHGGDGAAAAGGTSYSLSLSAAGANSGLKDTATGSNILLYQVGSTIVGKVGGSGGDTAFVVSVDASGNVTLDQQRAIVHSNTSSNDEAASIASGLINLSSTLTDADGDKATAQIDLGKVISFKDDGPSVADNATVRLDDDSRPNGIAGGVGDDEPNSANTSGTLGHSFGADNAGSIQWLTTGAPAGFTYQASGTDLLIKQGSVTVMTVTLNTTSGAYTVTQNAVIDHALGNDENNQLFTLNYQVTDKDGDKANGTLNINVDDDTPLARNDVAYVQEAQGQNFNTVFVLDFSGSISNSELNTMLSAVKSAAQALFSGTSGDVKAQIVVFSSDATSYAPISNYADFAAKVDSLNPATGGTRPYDGNTDFSDAVSKVISAYTPIPGYSNQVFFISDGNPNENTGPGDVSLTTAVNTAWTNFVTSNNINITTIGVGDGIDNTHLQQVDVDGSGSPILVANFGSLASTLVAQITGGLISGNVLLGSNGVAGGGDDDSYGADGPGHIQSIQINGTTYSWGGSGNITSSAGATITGSALTNVTTAEGGKLSFNFSTGAWSYTAPTTVVGDKVETFQYSIVDHDGDPSSATLTVYVEDSAPVVARVEEDELPNGITDGDAFNTVASGSVADLLVGAGPATFSLNTNTAGLAAATSHGVALVYSVSGNTLTAKAGAAGATVFTLELQSNGDYTFTLKGPLDHPLGNGDDTEALSLNFASILKAANGSTPLTLAGGFLVQIEDDVPTVSLSSAQVATLQVDETNLAGNASASYASNFTTQYGADGAGSTTYSLKVSSDGANSGLKDSASGSDILLYQSGNTIVGKVGSASGAVAFTLTVNASSGQVTLDQDRAVLHLPDSGPNQAVTLGANDLVQLVATSKDFDGDSASTSLSLGNAISFRDDAPSVSLSGASLASLVVDESNLASNATGNFASAFSVNGGADGVATTAYSLKVSAANADSGLDDSATGQNVLLSVESGVVVGRTAISGDLVFKVSVDSTTGAVTLDQVRSVLHTPNTGPDQAVGLAANLIQLTATVTDKDGDVATADLNLGSTITLRDDAPGVTAGTAGADSLQVDESNLAGNATVNFASLFTVAGGADGVDSTAYSLKVSAANVNSGVVDTLTNQSVLLSVESGAVVGRTASSGDLVFKVSVDGSTGAVTLDQLRSVVHSPNSGPDQEVSLSAANLIQLVATVTDKDGDTATASLNLGSAISFRDDAPSITAGNAVADSLQVDESNLASNSTVNFASAFTVNGGADGVASTAYSLKVSASGVNSGVIDTATNQSVLLTVESGAVVGRTATSGDLVFRVSVDGSTGAVTLDQVRSVVHSPNSGPDQEVSLSAANLIQLTATVTDKDGDTAVSNLDLGHAISFRDDAPSAATITQSGQASVTLNTNLLIVLDNSGSMGESSGVGSMSRLDVAKSALLELFEQYDALGDVKVSVVSFSTTAVVEEVWVSIAQAKAAVLALQDTNNTNYDAALISAINAYGQAGKITTGNVQNVAYFLSDGEPNEPDGDAGISNSAGSASGWPAPFSNGNASEEQAWISFLNTNNIRAYALGMGNGVTVANLDPIAYNGVSHTNSNGQVVTDLSTLTTVLVGTAQASPLAGNLTTGGGFGADGGYVRSLTVDGKTFSYDKTTNVLTTTGSGPVGTNGSYAGNVITLNLASGGSLTVNVNSGAYAYTPPTAVSTAIVATILFTLSDLDGDTASAALNLSINASQAPMVIRDDLVLTNLDAQSGFDQVVIPTWALLANDTGVNHSLLSIIATSNLVDGNSVNHSATAVTFTEESNSARDGGSFTYTASIDGSTALDTAVVNIDRGQSGESSLDGTFRNEILIGRDGANDTLNGGDGDDILLGLGGNDKLYGGEGNDILAGGTGSNLLDGGNGVDTASYIDAAGGVTANLSTGVGSVAAVGSVPATSDSYSSIENLIGSAHNDTLTGNGSSNYLNGGAGNDTLVGGGGDDFLVGGKGDDFLTGGTGHDTFIWEKGGLGGIDHITDFTTSGANSDVLDLSQLLSGVAQVGSTLDDYLSFAFSGTTTTIGISTTAGAPAAQTVVLDTVNLSTTYASTDAATIINGMLSDHTLKTDTV